MPAWMTESVSFLAESQHSDGGWSYFGNADSAIEPTALAVAALHVLNEHKAARDRGLKFIASLKKPDGEIPPQPTQSDGTTIAAVGAIVSAGCGGDLPLAKTVVDRLLQYEPETQPRSAEISDDSTLRGFSWLPKTYSWVEPTAYGLILMHHAGMDKHARRLEGKKVLLDRAIPTGGWNYGNAHVFTHDLEPQPMASAIALLGLWDDKSSTVVTKGVTYLKSVAGSTPSVLSLGWLNMALRARGVSAVKPAEFEKLFAESDRSAHSAWHRAVALLATAPLTSNPFVI